MNYKLETYVGEQFGNVAKQAKDIASEKGFAHDAVEFDFNGIACVVHDRTDLELLHRDYSNAHLMEWKQVGPNCVREYSKGVLTELDRRTKKADEERAASKREYEQKSERERKAFDAKVSGLTIELSDAPAYEDWKAKNTDEYGACIFEYAEGWAKLMQVEIAKGKTVAQCAEETSFKMGFLGITGFMYVAAVGILSKCWKHGEDLRKWHNKDYGHEGDGVVNSVNMIIG